MTITLMRATKRTSSTRISSRGRSQGPQDWWGRGRKRKELNGKRRKQRTEVFIPVMLLSSVYCYCLEVFPPSIFLVIFSTLSRTWGRFNFCTFSACLKYVFLGCFAMLCSFFLLFLISTFDCCWCFFAHSFFVHLWDCCRCCWCIFSECI